MANDEPAIRISKHDDYWSVIGFDGDVGMPPDPRIRDAIAASIDVDKCYAYFLESHAWTQEETLEHILEPVADAPVIVEPS